MKKTDHKHIETIAIHEGMNSTSTAGSIVPPVEVSTIFKHHPDGHQEGDFLYSRMNNPNRQALEQLLTRLEGGEAALAFSSGLAAMSALYQWAGKGAHIIIPEDVYHGSWKLMDEFSEAWSIEFDMVDTSDLDKLQAAIRPETKLIHLETPSNPLLIITDVEKAVSLAHQHGIPVSVDNTWPTPYNLNPLSYGADMVIHSTTKYLGGHSDIIGGAIVFSKVDAAFERMKKIQIVQGGVPSPRDCWLLSRSIRSFPYRMRGHNANAAELVELLAEHPAVEQTYYPGLSSHPGHEIAKSQMRGFGGMISFLVKGGAREALKVVASSKLVSRATSLGGVESTWEHRASSEGETSPTPQNLIRISAGLEHPDDLREDIKQALDQIL